MSETQEQHKGCLLFGIAIGDRPPYQSVCRIEKPFSPPGWGVQFETTLPSGRFDTEDEAQQAGLRMARLFVDLNVNWFDSLEGDRKGPGRIQTPRA